MSPAPRRRPPRIGIVGGGPAALTLARILQGHGIAAAVIEADASAEGRPQGGTLDLPPDTGQRAHHSQPPPAAA